jgi:D-serine deaminase-like pyridoxal phosphate-dependent protein
MGLNIERMGAAASDLEITPAPNNKTAKVTLEELLAKIEIQVSEGDYRG